MKSKNYVNGQDVTGIDSVDLPSPRFHETVERVSHSDAEISLKLNSEFDDIFNEIFGAKS